MKRSSVEVGWRQLFGLIVVFSMLMTIAPPLVQAGMDDPIDRDEWVLRYFCTS